MRRTTTNDHRSHCIVFLRRFDIGLHLEQDGNDFVWHIGVCEVRCPPPHRQSGGRLEGIARHGEPAVDALDLEEKARPRTFGAKKELIAPAEPHSAAVGISFPPQVRVRRRHQSPSTRPIASRTDDMGSGT